MESKIHLNKVNKLSPIARIYIIRGFLSTALSGCVFFLRAGSWAIRRGGGYFIIAVIIVIISNLFVANKNPGLLDHRSKLRKGTKKWNVVWLLTFMLFFLYGMPFVAGYDIGRLGNQISEICLYFGLISFLILAFLASWAMFVNKFLEASVRIQADRGHYVISDDPYRYVRHPG